MKHLKAVIALAILVIVLPFLGFPHTWDTVLFMVLGACIIILATRALMLDARTQREMTTEKDTYQQREAPDAAAYEESTA